MQMHKHLLNLIPANTYLKNTTNIKKVAHKKGHKAMTHAKELHVKLLRHPRKVFIFFKMFLFTLSTHIYMRCFQYPLLSSPRIWTTPRHCDVNIMWLIEPMKIRPSVNSSIAGNRSMNCWPVNRTVCNYVEFCNYPVFSCRYVPCLYYAYEYISVI